MGPLGTPLPSIPTNAAVGARRWHRVIVIDRPKAPKETEVRLLLLLLLLLLPLLRAAFDVAVDYAGGGEAAAIVFGGPTPRSNAPAAATATAAAAAAAAAASLSLFVCFY